MDQQTWELASTLAHGLNQKGVTHNLVRQAAVYAHRFGESVGQAMSAQTGKPVSAQRGEAIALRDWLERLATLGSTFASGDEDATRLERENFKDTLLPAVQHNPGHDWPLLLYWVARLMVAYAPPPAPRSPNTRRWNR